MRNHLLVLGPNPGSHQPCVVVVISLFLFLIFFANVCSLLLLFLLFLILLLLGPCPWSCLVATVLA